MRRTLHELCVQLGFESTHAFCYRRLRHTQLAGGAADAARLDYGDEIPYLLEVQGITSRLSRCTLCHLTPALRGVLYCMGAAGTIPGVLPGARK